VAEAAPSDGSAADKVFQPAGRVDAMIGTHIGDNCAQAAGSTLRSPEPGRAWETSVSTPRIRLLGAAVSAVGALALVGCAITMPGTIPGTQDPSVPGQASASPTEAYPYTPAATPTIMPSGAFSKISTGGPTLAPTAGGPLNGKVIVVDPGHQGGFNPAILNRRVDTPFGPFMCAAAGSETVDQKVTEHALNWQVGTKLADVLRAKGATVILSRPDDIGVGPCNIDRARLANDAHADLLLSVHTDGQAMGRDGIADPQGFHTQIDTKIGGGKENKELQQRSLAFAENIVRNVRTLTDEPVSNYVPRKPVGVWQRPGDLMVLAGLTSAPGALIEMGNLKNPTDLDRLVAPAHQDALAVALEAAIEDTLLKPQFMSPSPEPTTASPTPSASASPSGKG
jgi:N-acetylmuramoyl-L-alanine amidase